MKIAIKWTQKSIEDLESIFEFYKSRSPRAAHSVIADIINGVESTVFNKQYQMDEINPDYRRLIIRHFKVLYKPQQEFMYIMRIFDTRQNPNRQQLE